MPTDAATTIAYVGALVGLVGGGVALFNAWKAAAVSPFLQLGEMDDDPRIQIYRTSLDMFLSWLALVASALDRKLFQVADIHDVGYWVAKIESEIVIHPFIVTA